METLLDGFRMGMYLDVFVDKMLSRNEIYEIHMLVCMYVYIYIYVGIHIKLCFGKPSFFSQMRHSLFICLGF